MNIKLKLNLNKNDQVNLTCQKLTKIEEGYKNKIKIIKKKKSYM